MWTLFYYSINRFIIIYSSYLFAFQPTQAAWRVVFITSACVYMVCCSVYLVFGDGTRQPWDNPSNDQMNLEHKKNKKQKQQKKKKMAMDVEDTVQWTACQRQRSPRWQRNKLYPADHVEDSIHYYIIICYRVFIYCKQIKKEKKRKKER